MKAYPLPIYLQRFFSERLATQLHASPNTVASYRDTFRLLLKYAAERLRRQPTELQVADLDANLIGDFLTFVSKFRLKKSQQSQRFFVRIAYETFRKTNHGF